MASEEGEAAASEGSGAISPTAHYTGETWVRNGLSHPELATWQGRLFHNSLLLPNAFSRLLGGPSLDRMLLARHRIIDALLEDLIEGGVSQVIEAACGMSPRGWRFAQRYGEDLTYVEADLPAMARRKREALARMGSLGDHHRVADVDVLRAGGAGSLEALVEAMDPSEGLVIITEGLLVYLDDPTMEALWARLARMLQPFPAGAYLADLRIESPDRGLVEHAAEVLLGAFVRGKVHPYGGDAASAEAALRAAGFEQARLHRCEEHPAAAQPGDEAGAGMLSIIEAVTRSL
jgi:O-methyltransferase involved in polyketide biosynthesis